MDKLRAMTGFVRIVDKGSLTAAAADLGVSLPSMVRSLAALERELGATLLNRTTRRINLTDDGRQYLEQCRAVLAQVQEAEACLHQALDVACRQQAKSWELRAAMSLSRLWQYQGKRPEAYELLAPIYGWFTEGFDTADLQEAKALLEALA